MPSRSTPRNPSSGPNRQIREKIAWFLKFADITIKAEEFVESATMNPAFEESAMFENMIDLMFKDEYEIYVFDTAPTANARRLLGMSKVYSLWVDKMLKSRDEAKVLRKALSYTKKEEKDPLMDYLLQFKDRMANAKVLLTDPAMTSFFFVTLPESPPHRGHHPVHPVVPRFRNSGGRSHRQRPDPEGDGQGRFSGIRAQPGEDAGRAHGGDLAGLRRWSPFHRSPLRNRDSRAGHAAEAGGSSLRLKDNH